jgi:NAD(P)H-flavin reductase
VLTLPVSEVLRATPRTRRIRLALGTQSFPFHAGQAVLLTVDEGRPARPYSIASAPAEAMRDGQLELLVRADEGGRDQAGEHVGLEGLPRAGQHVRIEGPIGRFTTPVLAPGQSVMIAAGGTGIAPLRAMLHDLLGRADAPAITLLYSARAGDEFAYLDELQALETRGALRLWLTVSRDDQTWIGRRGRVDQALLHETLPTGPDALVGLLCGPLGFVRDVRAALLDLGVPDAQIKREQYHP